MNSKSTSTPLELGTEGILSEPLTPNNETPIDFSCREAIGSLTYAMLCTRPNLGFPICFLSQFLNNPQSEHGSAVKPTMRYVKGTLTLKLKYEKRKDDIIGYTAVDWTCDVEKRKSTSRFIFLLGNGAVSWGRKKQACVALSTTET